MLVCRRDARQTAPPIDAAIKCKIKPGDDIEVMVEGKLITNRVFKLGACTVGVVQVDQADGFQLTGDFPPDHIHTLTEDLNFHVDVDIVISFDWDRDKEQVATGTSEPHFIVPIEVHNAAGKRIVGYYVPATDATIRKLYDMSKEKPSSLYALKRHDGKWIQYPVMPINVCKDLGGEKVVSWLHVIEYMNTVYGARESEGGNVGRVGGCTLLQMVTKIVSCCNSTQLPTLVRRGGSTEKCEAARSVLRPRCAKAHCVAWSAFGGGCSPSFRQRLSKPLHLCARRLHALGQLWQREASARPGLKRPYEGQRGRVRGGG